MKREIAENAISELLIAIWRLLDNKKLRFREWICMDRYESETIHQSGSKWEREIMWDTGAS